MRAAMYVLLLVSVDASAAAVPCESAAIAQAGKLLAFHTDGDERASVEPRARHLPPLANPVDKTQKLTVLEVDGHVYKADYRMRLIYFPIGEDCVLMGQEVLELARP